MNAKDENVLLRLDINEKEVVIFTKILPISIFIAYIIMLVGLYRPVFSKGPSLEGVLALCSMFVGAPIGFIVIYIILKNKFQDIAFRKDGIEWPIPSLSLKVCNKTRLVPYSEIGTCYIGHDTSPRTEIEYDYLYIDVKGDRWRYFIYQEHLDLDKITKILNARGAVYSKGSYTTAHMKYFGRPY